MMTATPSQIGGMKAVKLAAGILQSMASENFAKKSGMSLKRDMSIVLNLWSGFPPLLASLVLLPD